ncbi:class V lanthionine synthetase subunit LxmK [Streptomyces anandii]|uniref:class V lanthionine synthetase subunit LxmK n=1 Tax=Streptomyces anandii TaxID=285454 RepID=UPI0036F66B06
MEKTLYAPPDLDSTPEVDELLRRLEFGPFERDSLTSAPGRNEAWKGTTASGQAVFVKRLMGSPADVQARLTRLLQFQDLAADLQAEGPLRCPRLLGHDRQAALVAFECIEDAQTGALMMVEETFDDSLAFRAGQAIGTLHAFGPTRADLETEPPALPSLDLLHGVPEKMMENFSFGQISAWGLMQKDQQLVKGIASLLESESRAPKAPSHCDMRVDQFLVVDGALYIADWEEFRLADPARDVGAFAGEWLYRSILDIVTTRGDSTLTEFEMTHDLIVRRGVEKLERLRPRIVHFWSGYRSIRGEVDPQLVSRATAFAGWHTLDRLTASALRSVRLSGIERAAAGVGRAALLAPEKFATTLGFEEAA